MFAVIGQQENAVLSDDPDAQDDDLSVLPGGEVHIDVLQFIHRVVLALGLRPSAVARYDVIKGFERQPLIAQLWRVGFDNAGH